MELKPYPFCGGEAVRTKTENTIQDTVWGCYHYGISCSDPNCVGFDIVPRYRTYIRDYLYAEDLIFMRGLAKLNKLIANYGARMDEVSE